MRRQTRLRVQHCQQNKDISSSLRKSQMPFIDVSNTQQSGNVLFHVIIFLHVGVSLNVIFLLIDLLGTNVGIVFDDEENYHQKKGI
jgi:hypothetical protein